MSDWHSMETAPRDGTAIQAEIPGNGSDNVIAWWDGLLDSTGKSCGGWGFASEQEPPHCWTDGFCWEVNEDGEASVQPTQWKPLPRIREAAHIDDLSEEEYQLMISSLRNGKAPPELDSLMEEAPPIGREIGE